MQIVDELKRLGWVKASINKDLVKDDVQILAEEGKLRRRGSSMMREFNVHYSPCGNHLAHYPTSHLLPISCRLPYT